MHATMMWAKRSCDNANPHVLVTHNEHDKDFPKRVIFQIGDARIELVTTDAGLEQIANAIKAHPAHLLENAKARLQKVMDEVQRLDQQIKSLDAVPSAEEQQS